MSDQDRNEFEPLMTVEEVAEYLRFKPGTIRQWVKTREIPHVKAGRSTRFRKSDIDRWIEERTKEAA